ncbi:MAG: IS1595 family transposase [Gammaproteobacteria bacterium]|nr:IS1595 family transposase [Gammaproteobacteria bacterium]
MQPDAFHHWLSQAKQLSPSQREQAFSWFQQGTSSEAVLNPLFQHPPQYPHCHHEQAIRWGNSHGLPRYRCKSCGKTFNPLTGTPLAHLRHHDRWGSYAQALLDGWSVRKAAQHCGVHKDTAFRWRHRFLTLPAAAQPAVLEGIVEADETYFLESHKGERNLSRPPRKRGGTATKRGLSDEQIPVLIARDRSRTTFDAVLPQADSAALAAVLGPVIKSDAVLCSDGSAIYRRFTRQAGLEHRPVNLSAGIRAQGPFHIQNVNAYDSRLKGWMARFHGVATKYLANYLGWKRCLEKHAQFLSPQLMLRQAQGIDQQLTQT